jgi:hypothetical protein
MNLFTYRRYRYYVSEQRTGARGERMSYFAANIRGILINHSLWRGLLLALQHNSSYSLAFLLAPCTAGQDLYMLNITEKRFLVTVSQAMWKGL